MRDTRAETTPETGFDRSCVDRLHVCGYSSLDDMIYLEWRGTEKSPVWIALPRSMVIRPEHSVLLRALRARGIPLPADCAGIVAGQLDREASRLAG